MTSIDQRYIATKSLTEYFVDKATGKPITGGWVEFYKDNDRSSPKLVYQLSGSPPNYTFEALPNPVDISVGSLVNGDAPPVIITPYYFPYDENGDLELYYIKIYNEDAILQKELEAWPPDVAGNSSPTDAGNIINNQVSNSQFVDILFNEDYGTTIDISGPVSGLVVEIAPDWFLKISANGAGSVVVNRNELAGSLNIETNPPYELSILPEGGNISELKLFQRFRHNPDIWASEYLAGGVLISSSDGISHEVIMSYAPSVSASPTVITFGNTGPSGYFYLSDTILLGPGVNTDLPSVGYVDLVLTLPINGGVKITSVFLAGLDANNTVSYDQETVNRQEDYLFHYYNPLIQQVPVPSILQGWDFRVNPAQWGATQSMGAIGSASKYLWDQLIGWQSANNIFSVARGSPHTLSISVSNTGQLALVQYFTGAQLTQLLTSGFSVLMKMAVSGFNCAGTVSFWTTTDVSLPSMSSNLSLINSLDANGKPNAFHGNWTEIPRNYRGDAKFATTLSGIVDIPLEGWNNQDGSVAANATFGAIVIGFAPITAPQTIIIQSISCNSGSLARPCAPLSYNETLSILQYYYEKSYGADISPGAVTAVNSLARYQGLYGTTPSVEIHPTGFSIEFRNIKRTTATTSLYSPTGAINNVRLVRDATVIGNIPTTNWNAQAGSYGALYLANNNTPIDTGGSQQAIIDFHYVADARLGVVL